MAWVWPCLRFFWGRLTRPTSSDGLGINLGNFHFFIVVFLLYPSIFQSCCPGSIWSGCYRCRLSVSNRGLCGWQSRCPTIFWCRWYRKLLIFSLVFGFLVRGILGFGCWLMNCGFYFWGGSKGGCGCCRRDCWCLGWEQAVIWVWEGISWGSCEVGRHI